MTELLEQDIAKLKTRPISDVVTIDLDEPPERDPTSTTPMQHAGILETDPTFDDWMDKLAEIRRAANEINDDEI
jgi:hypothetical protein